MSAVEAAAYAPSAETVIFSTVTTNQQLHQTLEIISTETNQHFTESFTESFTPAADASSTETNAASETNAVAVVDVVEATAQPMPEPISDQQFQTSHTPADLAHKWVKNISDKQLTTTELDLLSKGAGFSVSPVSIPTADFLAANEFACKLISSKGQAAALRAEVTEILKHDRPLSSNLTAKERTALSNLRNDDSITIVPADKGKALVVMNTCDYISKMEEKLADTNTYQPLKSDPTLEIQSSLIDRLKIICDELQISETQYRDLYPRETKIPRMRGQPKIHKEGFPKRDCRQLRRSYQEDRQVCVQNHQEVCHQ